MPSRPKAEHHPDSPVLEGLNPEQAEAVQAGEAPLLIVAGAGTGKTKTLVHRVAAAIQGGVDPSRVLLLTFTRRAAAEMLRRVDELLRRLGGLDRTAGLASRSVWGGTFHAVAARLLRSHGRAIGLEPDFSIHDRGDSEDLMDVVRNELELAKTTERFPKKGTAMAIYSHMVNSRRSLSEVLATHFPWCAIHATDLKRLFDGYLNRKEKARVLDYDDLLLDWLALLEDPGEGPRVRQRFDRVLVDEYQDTNRLQGDLLKGLAPGGRGLTVVGDDAQAIYSFRGATVRNILDFPKEYPGTRIVKLEQNYRSTRPILRLTNAVIAQARERHAKELRSERAAKQKPRLVTCEDEHDQADFLVRRILELREQGTALKEQAVLFRASHHSIALEAELGRHGIPFVKYGGLKFIEAAHVKDLMCFLRLAENPQDVISGTRVLRLLPGIGPKTAHDLMGAALRGPAGLEAWRTARVPPASRKAWQGFRKLLEELRRPDPRPVAAQVHRVRSFYAPLLEAKYDNAQARLRDLEQLEQLATRCPDRRTLLVELALDPPNSTEDLAGPPSRDDDFLVLSTIHSAKGLEWDAVYVIHASDGNIPSDLATGSAEQIEEERRLFYVALTRARSQLEVLFPLRCYVTRGFGDDHHYGQLTRFLTPKALKLVERRATSAWTAPEAEDDGAGPGHGATRRRVRKQVRSLWS